MHYAKLKYSLPLQNNNDFMDKIYFISLISNP